MEKMRRRWFSQEQKAELWERWKSGQALGDWRSCDSTSTQRARHLLRCRHFHPSTWSTLAGASRNRHP